MLKACWKEGGVLFIIYKTCKAFWVYVNIYILDIREKRCQ